MNKESLEKMSRMRLLGMHQALLKKLWKPATQGSLPMMSWYITWFKASGMTASTETCKEGLRTPTSGTMPAWNRLIRARIAGWIKTWWSACQRVILSKKGKIFLLPEVPVLGKVSWPRPLASRPVYLDTRYSIPIRQN